MPCFLRSLARVGQRRRTHGQRERRRCRHKRISQRKRKRKRQQQRQRRQRYRRGSGGGSGGSVCGGRSGGSGGGGVEEELQQAPPIAVGVVVFSRACSQLGRTKRALAFVPVVDPIPREIKLVSGPRRAPVRASRHSYAGTASKTCSCRCCRTISRLTLAATGAAPAHGPRSSRSASSLPS